MTTEMGERTITAKKVETRFTTDGQEYLRVMTLGKDGRPVWLSAWEDDTIQAIQEGGTYRVSIVKKGNYFNITKVLATVTPPPATQEGVGSDNPVPVSTEERIALQVAAKEATPLAIYILEHMPEEDRERKLWLDKLFWAWDYAHRHVLWAISRQQNDGKQ